jgi:hypothetical protein
VNDKPSIANRVPAGVTRDDGLLPLRLAVAAALTVLVARASIDPDLWGHVRFGLDILDAGHLPPRDHYSFTSDIPWVNHEWLAEVLMALAFRTGGPAGLGMLRLCLLGVTAACIVAAYHARPVSPIAQDALIVVGGLLVYAVVGTIRPQLFSVALFATMLFLLTRGPSPPYRFAASILFLPWVNLHGGWILGIGTFGLWSVVEAAGREITPRGRTVAGLAVVTAIALTLLNPYGQGIWEFIHETVGLSRPDITEWQPAYGSPAILLWVIAAITLAVALVSPAMRPSAPEIVVLLMIAFASLRVMRLLAFFGIAVTMLVGPRIADRFGLWSRERPEQRLVGRRVYALLVMSCLAALAYASWHISRTLPCINVQAQVTPDREAAEFVRRNSLSGRALTYFDYGEYVIWHFNRSVRVSLDGRRETVYSRAVLEDHWAFNQGSPRGLEVLKRLDPDFIWIPVKSEGLRLAVANGYREAHRGETSSILVRRDVATVAVPKGSIEGPRCFPSY